MGRLGEGHYHELRVHGAAATPPEAMLRVPQETPGGSTAHARVLQRPLDHPEWRAYCWSSLTSGTWHTALWLLLVPFMLANVAGWMLLPAARATPTLPPHGAAGAPPRDRSLWAGALCARLLGVLVTLIFTLSAYLVVVDIGAYQWLVGGSRWHPVTLGAGVLLTAGVVYLVARAARPRPREHPDVVDAWKDDVDPFGYAWLHAGQSDLWRRPVVVTRLRVVHLTAAWSAIALVAGWSVPGPTRWVGAAGLGLAVLLVGAITPRTGPSTPRWATVAIRWVARPVGAFALLLAAAHLSWSVPTGPILPNVRGAGAVVAVAFLLLVGLLWWFGRRGVPDIPDRARWNAPGMLLLAAATGAGLGAGLALQAERLIEGRTCLATGDACVVQVDGSIPWLAIGFALILGMLGWELLRRFARAWQAVDPDSPARGMIAVRTMTEHGSWLTRLLAILASVVTAGGLVVVLRTHGELDEVLRSGWWALAWVIVLGPAVIAGLWLLIELRRPRLSLAVAAAAAGVALCVWRGWDVTVLGVRLPPRTFLDLAQLLTLVLPLVVVLNRVVTGLRRHDVRRGIGVLWDLGTFWPRWFHPFAPPTYSDRAVTDLTSLLDGELGRQEADPERLLLAPHSQGSIIATAAVLGMTAPTQRLALLTYGSPWTRHYAEFFPAVFSPACLDALASRLVHTRGGIRWRNLFRVSDPMAGQIAGPEPGPPLSRIDIELAEDPCNRLHSSYDLERPYHDAVRVLRGMLGA